jgi:hypothetical protein
MIEQLRNHIEKKFAASEVQWYPFPYLVIENFFPQDIYADILARNPFKKVAGTEWKPRGRKPDKTATPYWARTQVNFARDKNFEIDGQADPFWNQLKDTFLKDHWFEKLVVQKNREYFMLRFGELVETGDFYSHFKKELFLQQHEPGYYIGPHTDIPTRIFTCIFAFADRDGFEEYGTELCVHKDPMVRCWGNNHYTPDDFTVTKLAPYKPNNFLLFFKTRQSFHSVKAIDESVPNRRYGMQFQLYEPQGGLFKDLSEPELLKTRLRKGFKTKAKQIWSIIKQ